MRNILPILILLVTSVAIAVERPRKTHTLLIVTTQQQEAANAAVVEAVGPLAANTFHVPFHFGAGTPNTPTHYVACWAMDEATLAKVEAALKELKGTKPTILRHSKLETAKSDKFQGRPVEELRRRGAKRVRAAELAPQR